MVLEASPAPPAERLACLRLARSENVGPVTFRQLLRRFGSARAALDALPELARRGGRRRPVRLCPEAVAQAELDRLAALDAHLLTLPDAGYPAALAAADDAPPVLTLRGRPALLGRPAAAVVGARNASANGRRFTEALARDLAAAGLLVVSGLARGIDTAAHRGALPQTAGDGGTAAVLAGGIDVVYPPENAGLAADIAEQGLLLSEMPPGLVPQARHFPRRNRIISGLSLGVVVVEAALRSGSLITARLANEQGREVFAVPGSPLDPRARGGNDLLRQGATLVECADDVLAVLAPQSQGLGAAPTAVEPAAPAVQSAPEPTDGELEKARTAVLAALGPSALAVDELLRQCQVSAAIASLILLELELAGRIERQPGNRIALIAARP